MHASLSPKPLQALSDSLSLWRQEQESLDGFIRSNIGGLAMTVGVVSYLTHLHPHAIHSIVQEQLLPRLEEKGFSANITHLQRSLFPQPPTAVLVEPTCSTAMSPLEGLCQDMLSQPSWDPLTPLKVTVSSHVLLDVVTALTTRTWNKWPLVYDIDYVTSDFIRNYWGEDFISLDCRDWSVVESFLPVLLTKSCTCTFEALTLATVHYSTLQYSTVCMPVMIHLVYHL